MLQKKAPKGLKPLDAELKSAPEFRRPALQRILRQQYVRCGKRPNILTEKPSPPPKDEPGGIL